MQTFNRIFLMGYLGNVPEMSQTSQGAPYTQLSIATHRKWQDDKGERTQRTDWHRVNVFGNRAETCCRYLEKGRPLFIEGEIQTYMKENPAGESIQRIGITARRIDFLPNSKEKLS